LIPPFEFDEFLGKKSLASPFRKPGFSIPPPHHTIPTNLKKGNFKGLKVQINSLFLQSMLEGGISIVKKNNVVQKNLFTNNKKLVTAPI